MLGHVRSKVLIGNRRSRSFQRLILSLDRTIEVEDIASTLLAAHRSARLDERVPALAMEPTPLRYLDVAADASLEAYRLHSPTYLGLPESQLAETRADVAAAIAEWDRTPFERNRARFRLQMLRHIARQYRDEL